MPRMLKKSIEKVFEEMSRYPRSSSEGQSDLRTFVGSFPDGDFKAGRGEAIIKKNLS